MRCLKREREEIQIGIRFSSSSSSSFTTPTRLRWERRERELIDEGRWEQPRNSMFSMVRYLRWGRWWPMEERKEEEEVDWMEGSLLQAK